ncbi:class II aldolase/adducin family protein [Microbacterium sp.]|uniref:class II aldolase/adducin family protein n=1 Tax=Microbacterium sp. TaxID=51671 RepID=UPI003A94EAE3
MRDEIVRACRALTDEGLVVATAGNVSVRTDHGMLITPSGLPYASMTAADVVAVDGEGHHDPAGPLPSSESDLHLAAYRADPAANAVVHFHGRWTSAVASTERDAMPATHYYAARLDAPIPIAPYAHFGSPELARSVGGALATHRAALMANHGATVTGSSLFEAMDNARLLEWLCRLHMDTGAPPERITLTDTQLSEVARTYARRRQRIAQ